MLATDRYPRQRYVPSPDLTWGMGWDGLVLGWTGFEEVRGSCFSLCHHCLPIGVAKPHTARKTGLSVLQQIPGATVNVSPSEHSLGW